MIKSPAIPVNISPASISNHAYIGKSIHSLLRDILENAPPVVFKQILTGRPAYVPREVIWSPETGPNHRHYQNRRVLHMIRYEKMKNYQRCYNSLYHHLEEACQLIWDYQEVIHYRHGQCKGQDHHLRQHQT
jgi:hypothetical protein